MAKARNSLERKITRFARNLMADARFCRGLADGVRVLDLGCGKGEIGQLLMDVHPSIELHGIDLLPERDVPAFYTYRVVDLEKSMLPYPDDYFDAILLVHVIEHLQRPLSLGNEIHRILKPEGRIYVETPNWTSMLVPSFGFHREQHHPFNFFDDPSHVKPWSRHGLFEFLHQGCRLRVERVSSGRSWLRVPFDLPAIVLGIIRGERRRITSSFWNLTGWCIYGIGVKQ